MSLDIVKLNPLEPPMEVEKHIKQEYDDLFKEYNKNYSGIKNRLAGKFSKEKKLNKVKFIDEITSTLVYFAKQKAYYPISKQFCGNIDAFSKSLCLMLKNLGVKPPKIPNEILSNSGKHILRNYTGCKEKLNELSQLVEKKFWDTAQIEGDPSRTKERFLEMTEFIGIEKIAENAIKSIKELADTKNLNESLEALVKGYDQYLKKGAIKTLEDALEYSRTRLNEIVCHLNSRVIEWEVADSQLLSLIICLEKICAKAKEYPNKQNVLSVNPEKVNKILKKLNETLKQREKFCQTLDTIYVFDNNMIYTWSPFNCTTIEYKEALEKIGTWTDKAYEDKENKTKSWFKTESQQCLEILTNKTMKQQYDHAKSDKLSRYKGPYYVLVDSNSQLIKDGCQQGAVGTTGTINRSSTSPDAENEVLRFLQVSVLKGDWAKKGEYEDKDAVTKYFGVINKEINGAK